MSLGQILFHQETLFAIIMYSISVLVVIPIFYFIHEKLNHHLLQYLWDKIGTPILRSFLIIGFILLVYPLNFGIEDAPSVSTLLNKEELRFDFLLNIIFLLTFLFPLLPVIGKWDEFIIPLQGILCSIILFNWLCQAIRLEDYYLLPGLDVFFLILIISLITHWLVVILADPIGEYMDTLFERTGFKLLVFQCVLMIMQSPVIFIYSLSLGKQLH